MPPLVSVIIPTYNCEPYIAESIDSVLLQDGVDMEIIVVNDGSTDNTKQVIAKYGNRIKYINRPTNEGPSAARNLAIQHASGRFIAFQDADDIWFPKKLSMELDALQRYPDARLIFTDVRLSWHKEIVQTSASAIRLKNWCRRNTTPIPALYYGNLYRELVLGNCICTITVLIHRDVLNKAEMFDETLKIGEDYDLWLRIARDHPVIYLDQELCEYRLRDEGLSGPREVRRQRWLDAHARVREKHLRSNWVPEQYRAALADVLSEDYWQLGSDRFSQGQYKEARTYFLKGLTYCPHHARNWLYGCSTFLPLRVIDSARSLKHALKIGRNPPTL